MNNRRKFFLLIIFFFCGVGLLWKSQTKTTIKNLVSVPFNSEVILKNDLKKLEANLKPETLHDEDWRNVNDYSLSTKKLVNAKNAKHLFKLTNGTIASLASCLKKNFCGMERRSDGDAYFDENKTPGHILLARNLSIMLACLRINPELQDEIDWDIISELTDNSNENIQVLAVELIKDFKESGNDHENLFKVVDNYKGNAKALALVELSSTALADERILLVNSLEKAFSIDDPNTVISIVEKLSQMNLSKDETLKVSKNLCRFKENGIKDPNWKMIKYDLGKARIDLDKICAN